MENTPLYPEPIGKAIGSNIRVLRKLRKQTLEQISTHSGLSLTYLSAIERGEKPNIPIDTLSSICNSLGVPPSLLMLISETKKGVDVLTKISPNIEAAIKDASHTLLRGFS